MHEAALGAVGRDTVDAAQQQRVVRDDQLRAPGDRLVDGLVDRVDAEQDLVHLLGRVAADEPDGVPRFGEFGRVRLFQGGDDFG